MVAKVYRRVKVYADIENKGSDDHTFFASVQYIHVASNTAFSGGIEDEFVKEGSTDEVRIVTHIAEDAPKGIYDLEVYLWKSESNGIGEDLLGKSTYKKAFEVF